MKPTLLFVGDAACDSGFSRATHEYIKGLLNDWNVSVCGINYLGDPHPYDYPIYPAFAGGDGFGVRRMKELVRKLKPSVVVCMNDPWNIPQYQKECGDTPFVAIVAVDGKNCKGAGLNACESVVFWTEFGEREARLGGFTGRSAVIPLGVDLGTFRPIPQIQARAAMFGVQEGPNAVRLSPKFKDAFIVGNVNRNQPRKRMDLTIEYFAEWVKAYKIPNAHLYLHIAPTGDDAFDVQQLMRYYGFASKDDPRLILADVGVRRPVTDEVLCITLNSFDVGLTTTQGEGFGLTTFEMMACGVPVIVPDYSALGELCSQGAIRVNCTSHAVTPQRINVVGGIVDKQQTIEALQWVYTHREEARQLGEQGLALVHQDRFRWSVIASQLNEHLKEVIL